jgi:DNA-binding transcriptional regulator YiaG
MGQAAALHRLYFAIFPEAGSGQRAEPTSAIVALSHDISYAKFGNINNSGMQVHVGSTRRSGLNRQADISRLIRELRDRTGLTQEKFAARLGVTFPTINRWENGRAKPSPLAMQKIEELVRSMGERGRDLLEKIFGEEPL